MQDPVAADLTMVGGVQRGAVVDKQHVRRSSSGAVRVHPRSPAAGGVDELRSFCRAKLNALTTCARYPFPGADVKRDGLCAADLSKDWMPCA